MISMCKDPDGWGNYVEYSAQIGSLKCLMETVVEKSTLDSLGNEGVSLPIEDMGNIIRDQVAPEKVGETSVGRQNSMSTDSTKDLEDKQFREIWWLEMVQSDAIQKMLGLERKQYQR